MHKIVTAALVIAASTVTPPSAAAQRAASEAEIRQQADRFIAAIGSKDIDQFVSLFTTEPDFIYVDGGRIYPNPAALRNAGAGFFRSLKNFGGNWDPAKITVFGPDAATFTGVLNVQAADTTGRAIWPNGKIWTLVYQRRGGEWKIVQAHEATVPPPR